MHFNHDAKLPNQELSGAKSELQGETVGVWHFIIGAANHPIILHYEACKCAYLCIYSKWSIYE